MNEERTGKCLRQIYLVVYVFQFCSALFIFYFTNRNVTYQLRGASESCNFNQIQIVLFAFWNTT
jgi:hypothetical protein